jgi:hypothetical protein
VGVRQVHGSRSATDYPQQAAENGPTGDSIAEENPKGKYGPSPLDNHSHYLQNIAMITEGVIKNREFELISEFAQPDSKKRLSLGEALTCGVAYNVYRNALGQLVLDPVKTIPLSEAWLWENPSTLASVKRGLAQAAAGDTHDLGDFTGFAKE